MTIPNVTLEELIDPAWGNAVADAINNAKAAASVATSQSTSSTSYTDLATVGPTVTMVTGSLVRVTVICTPAAVGGSDSGSMTVAVSGATTISATDMVSRGLSVSGTTGNTIPANDSIVLVVTPGTNTFTAKYAGIDGGGGGVSASFANRRVIVERLD